MPGTLSLLASAVVIGAAPFMGELRNMLKAAFPDAFAAIVAVAIGVTIVTALVVAAVRIRDRRGWRLGALLFALGIVVAQTMLLSTGNREVDLVERFHFVQYGIVAILYYRAFVHLGAPASIVLALLSGTLVGILDEWVQWLVPSRVGVVQDVLLDVIAVTAGTVFAMAVQPPRWTGWRLPSTGYRIRWLVAAWAIAFAVFVHCAHLGYGIEDEGTGSFRSVFTQRELIETGTARARKWRTNPPRELRLLAREDRYLTEAGWHVRARNEAEARGDFRQAALENRIVEKYYAAFLDVDSFLGRGPHRWTDTQRVTVEARGSPLAPEAYASATLANRIVTWPGKLEFWLLIVALTTGLLARGSRSV